MSQEPTIQCACPKCAKSLRVPAGMQGKRIVCKVCQTHFVVQPLPATAPAATAKAHAAAPAAAASAPAAASDELPPIPLDDVPSGLELSHAAPPAAARETKIDKLKVDATGPYYVAKIFLAGKSVNVEVERVLNEQAAEGWELKQLFAVGEYAYAILHRDQHQSPAH